MVWYFSGTTLISLYQYGGHSTTSSSQVQPAYMFCLGTSTDDLAPFGQLQPLLTVHRAEPSHPRCLHHSEHVQPNFTHRNI